MVLVIGFEAVPKGLHAEMAVQINNEFHFLTQLTA